MLQTTEKIKVAVRCRPLSPRERDSDSLPIIKISAATKEIIIKDPLADAGEPQKSFVFDNILNQSVTQEDLYHKMVYPLINSVLEGYNGTVFAYGQTGTGKTYTIEGVSGVKDLEGVMPRAFEHIFQHIGQASHKEFIVQISYFEIYNECLNDLLLKKSHGNLSLRELPDIGIYVGNLSSFVVCNVTEILEKLRVGQVNRAVEQTRMSMCSSRSHSIFSITIESSEHIDDDEDRIKIAKLNFVDLAGSEELRIGTTRSRLWEAYNINKSLMSLKRVITCLRNPKRSHVPYRDSKITRLLQDALGGNAKTVMIATIGPADFNYEDTLRTLQCAEAAKCVKNKPKINELPNGGMLREWKQEIDRVRKELEGMLSDDLGSEKRLGDEKKLRRMEERFIRGRGEIRTRKEEERKKKEEIQEEILEEKNQEEERRTGDMREEKDEVSEESKEDKNNGKVEKGIQVKKFIIQESEAAIKGPKQTAEQDRSEENEPEILNKIGVVENEKEY